MSEDIEIAVEVITQTDSAFCVDTGLTENVWIPKSQISDSDDDYNPTCIFIPEWLALEKGLI